MHVCKKYVIVRLKFIPILFKRLLINKETTCFFIKTQKQYLLQNYLPKLVSEFFETEKE